MSKWLFRLFIIELAVVILFVATLLFFMQKSTKIISADNYDSRNFFLDATAFIYLSDNNSSTDESLESLFQVFPPLFTVHISEGEESPFDMVDDLYSIYIKGHFTTDIPNNTRLLFRLENMYMRMYINKQEVFNFEKDKNQLSYVKTSGNKWVSFVTPQIKVNDEIIFVVKNYYKFHAALTFNRFVHGIYSATSKFFMTREFAAIINYLVFSILVISSGILLLSIYFIFLLQKRHYERLFFIALATLFAGGWFLTDFYYTSFFITNPVICNVVYVTCMVCSLVCLCEYMVLDLKKLSWFIIKTMSQLLLFLLPVAYIHQITGVCDVFDFLDTFIISGFLLLLLTVLFLLFSTIKTRSFNNLNVIFRLCGCFVFLVGYILDNCIQKSNSDALIAFTKIGFAIFLFSEIRFVIVYFQDAVKKSADFKFVQQLAYKDEMTHVGNKLAWQKKCKELSNDLANSKLVGIIEFDVNNLKIINDTKGHDVGDRYIQSVSNTICNVFRRSAVFRIGGDEFVTVISDEACRLVTPVTEESLKNFFYKKFAAAITEKNKHVSDELKLNVACGFALSSLHDTKIEDVFNRADENMYKEKQRMKNTPILSDVLESSQKKSTTISENHIDQKEGFYE